MSIRHSFGPTICGHVPDLKSAGGKVLRGVRSALMRNHKPGSTPGTVDFDAVLDLESHDPDKHHPLVEAHAIFFAAGHGIPTDPKVALAHSGPKASASTEGLDAGGELTIPVAGVPIGPATGLTVLGHEVPDDVEPTPAPSDPPAPADPAAETTPAPADPSAVAPATS